MALKWANNGATEFLFSKITPTNGEVVQFIRSADGMAVSITAIPAVDNASSEDIGVIINTRSQDFIVEMSELETEPVRGDKFIRTFKNFTLTYEVMGEEGEPPVREHDRYREAWRVHTKRIDAVITSAGT